MANTKWHSGPPPSLGWWPATIDILSFLKVSPLYRWWDGSVWSIPAHYSRDAWSAGVRAERKDASGNEILWQHRPANWPKNSLT